MADTTSDLQRTKMRQWLITNVVETLDTTIEDIAYEYYFQRSSIPPPKSNGSVTDQEMSYYRVVTGLTTGSLADLEKAFYDTKGIAAGTLEDRAYAWWSGVIT